MAVSTFNTDVVVNGQLSATTMVIADSSVTNAKVSSAVADRIAAAKLISRQKIRYSQVNGTDVVAASIPVDILYGDATIVAVEVMPVTAPTGGDKAFTVDVQKSTGAGAYATVLSSVVTVNSSSTDRTLQAATLSVTATVDGDSLQVVVAVSGSSGSQGQGVVVTIITNEDPA